MQSASDDAGQGAAAERRLVRLVLLVAAFIAAWLLTWGDLDPFAAEPLGLTFNSMLDHMLRGRWDVDPAAIGFEAFAHDGRAYAYFGPLPALLRAPLLLVPTALLPDWRQLHVERLSCWLAIMLGIVAQTRAVLSSLQGADPAVRSRLAPPLLMACALSGPPMLAWRGALIYHESILWAWALAALFVALALPLLRRPDPAGTGRLCALAVCAGLCSLTRVTTGAGLLIATALLLMIDQCRSGIRWRAAAAQAALLALAGVAMLAVNAARWGNPLTFADLRMQTVLIANYPDRLARLERHGLFEWGRLPTGLLYYLFPIWTEALERLIPLHDRLIDLYDRLELPASSLLLTDPAWCLLALAGVAALRHPGDALRRPPRLPAVALLAGLSVAPLLMLLAWYGAFRYRAEFAPLLLALACLGLRDRVSHLVPGRATAALTVLCFLQVVGSMGANWSYAAQSFSPSPRDAAISLRCLVVPAACR